MAVHIYKENDEVKFMFTGEDEFLSNTLELKNEDIKEEVKNEKSSNL
jgi:hypothetical protein